jgi:hypothetical protein
MQTLQHTTQGSLVDRRIDTQPNTAATFAPGLKLYATMCAFSNAAHRRRRSGPDRTVTVDIFAR